MSENSPVAELDIQHGVKGLLAVRTVTQIESISALAECETVEIQISELQLGDSPRRSEDAAHVQALAAVKAPLPPIIVHRSTMRVIDGAHRLRAAQLRGDTTIEVKFFEGTARAAFVLAVRLNSAHGLPLTLADRKSAALRIIEYHPDWSNRAIAAVAGISDKTVAALRDESTSVPPSDRMGRDGRIHPRDRVDGRIRASEIFAENPTASAREVARASGISPTTAKDVRARMRRGEHPVPSHQRARAGVVAAPVPATVPVRPQVDRRAVVNRLRSDPSIRFSESGRTLLRWLEAPGATNSEWEQIARNLPGHCTDMVADLARLAAADWARFASVLHNRSQQAS